jgi:hypothetical protein
VIERLIVGLLAAALLVTQVQLQRAEREASAQSVRADSIAADKVASEIALDSVWAVRYAQDVDGLQARLTATGDTVGTLAARLDSASVRVNLLAEVAASAQGEIVSLSDRAGVLADSLSKSLTIIGQVGGDIQDEILTGSWSLWLPTMQHTLRYSVTIPGELVISETGDGRTLVTARSTIPRARLNIGEVFVDRPAPEVEYRVSLKQAGALMGIGAVVWELMR